MVGLYSDPFVSTIRLHLKAVVFLSFIIGVSILWWLIAGRKYFTGPLIEAEVQSLSSGDTQDLKFDKTEVVGQEVRHQRAV